MYTVIPTDKFNSDVEYYFKKKKYRKIQNDIKVVTNELQQGNLIGDLIPDIAVNSTGHTIKVRTVNTDTNVGKSNGYRIIYYAIKDDKEIYLLTIYSKKDDNRIPTNKEIEDLVIEYCT